MRVEGSQLSSYKTDGTVGVGASDHFKQAALSVATLEDKHDAADVRQLENKEISSEDLEKKVKQLNKAAEALERRFQFVIHKETHRIIVKVFRKDNDELIAEIPPHQILDVLAKIDEEMGLLVDTKA
jgi:flagellar protein FlaG